jgi:hypothetical protein
MIRSVLALTTAGAAVLAPLASRTLTADGTDTYVATQPTGVTVA